MKRQKAVRKRPLWQPLTLPALDSLLYDAAHASKPRSLNALTAIRLSHEALKVEHYDRPAWLFRKLEEMALVDSAVSVAVAEMLGVDMKTLERQSRGVFEFKATHDAELEFVPW